jgi:Na+/melibiose symporter-like transporter
MVKFGFGIAGGLTGLIFSIIGWDSGAETQTVEAVLDCAYSFQDYRCLEL